MKSNTNRTQHNWVEKAVVFVQVIVFIWIILALSGGLGGFINNIIPTTNPEGDKVSKLRNEFKAKVDKAHQELGKVMQYEDLGNEYTDICVKGHSDFKSSDDFSQKCTYSATRFYGFNSDNFSQSVKDLEKTIAGIGWIYPSSNGVSLSSVISEYYESYSETGTQYDRNYTASDLPTVGGHYFGYIRTNENMYLSFRFTDMYEQPREDIGIFQFVGDTIYSDIKPISSEDISTKSKDKYRYIVAVELFTEYFKK